MTSAKDKLAALRAQYAASDSNANNNNRNTNYYPFWDMKNGQRAIVRFLPDLDKSNPRGFILEKFSHRLEINGKAKQLPCLATYGEQCPICKLAAAYYKVEDKINGKKYYKKKQYLAQALIIDDPLPVDEATGENSAGKVKILALGPQIYNVIKEAFASTDDPLEADPSDFHEGYDFIIKKTDGGQYANYASGTKFHSRQRGLTEDEISAANEGMIELNTLIPQNPGIDYIQRQLDAEQNGSEDDDQELPQSTARAEKPAAKAPVKEQATADVGDEDVQEMLAAIKARRQAG